jgi:hypothetical protein
LLAFAPGSWVLLVRDVGASGSVLPPGTFPAAGHVNHSAVARGLMIRAVITPLGRFSKFCGHSSAGSFRP